jgi:hypothetical protein
MPSVAESVAYAESLAGFRARNTEHAEYTKTLDDCSKHLRHLLCDVTSCFIVGAGRAERELELIGRAMPSLRRLTAVEPNEDLASQLTARIQRVMPAAEVDVHVSRIEDWNGPITGDVILLFHVLQYIEPSYLPQFYRRLQLARSTRPTYVLTLVEADPADSRDLFRAVGTEIGPTTAELETSMASVGYELVSREQFFYEYDVSGDEGVQTLANMIYAIAGKCGVSRQAAVDAIRRLQAVRHRLRFSTELAIYKLHGRLDQLAGTGPSIKRGLRPVLNRD